MSHTRNPGFVIGDHWNTCQRCGFDMRASGSKLDPWKNLIVCKDCWEPLHPQLYIKTEEDSTKAEGLVTGKVD